MTASVSFIENPAVHAADFAALQYAAMPQGAWSAAFFADICAQPGVFAVIAEGDRLEVTGFLLARTAADECEVLTLAVHPAARREGMASALLEGAARRARGSGAATLFLEVAATNLPALALYEKAGFRHTGTRKAYYGGETDARLMQKAL
jgi:ribosomal-protein-alanine N-acetyltransferase